MKIADWLKQSTLVLLNEGITSARLDCLILLEYVLKKDRIFILSHDDSLLTEAQIEQLNAYITRRKIHEPIAYICGSKEFYGRNFIVSPRVLIPRPESETIIDILKTLQLPNDPLIIDVGTGSGALAITASLEYPSARVHGYDIDPDALIIATNNNKSLNGSVEFSHRDLLTGLTEPAHCIMANLPYVANNQPVSPDANFEPSLALFADNDGLDLIYSLIDQITEKTLVPGGYLLLESEPRQHARIQTHAEAKGFILKQNIGFIQLFQQG